mgnify:FL=1
MLILVAVTVTVAKDGGLFETARTAKTGTQKEADRENLLAALTTGYQEGGDFDLAKVSLPTTTMKWCNESDESFDLAENIRPSANGNWVITKSNNKFYVDKYGNILNKPATDPSKNEESYITFSKDTKLPKFTVAESIPEKDYSKFSYAETDKDGKHETNQIWFHNDKGDEFAIKVYGEESVIVLEFSDTDYTYALKATTFEDTAFPETGWYVRDNDGNFITTKLSKQDFPIMEPGWILGDSIGSKYEDSAIDTMNEYFGQLFIEVK